MIEGLGHPIKNEEIEMSICEECKHCIKSWSDGGDYSNPGWNRGCMKYEKPQKRSPQSGEMEYTDNTGSSYMFYRIKEKPKKFFSKTFDKQYKGCDEVNPTGECKVWESGEPLIV